MAKINARGTRQVGPTMFTERARTEPRSGASDVDRIYYEAWRLRSDGVLQTRLISTRPAEGEEGYETNHSSAFRNVAKMKRMPENHAEAKDRLQALLERRGMTIVKEMYR